MPRLGEIAHDIASHIAGAGETLHLNVFLLIARPLADELLQICVVEGDDEAVARNLVHRRRANFPISR